MAIKRPRFVLVDVRSRARTYLSAAHHTDDLKSLPEELSKRRASRHRRTLYTEVPIHFLDLLQAGEQQRFAIHELTSALLATSATQVANYLLVTDDSGSNAATLFASDARTTKRAILAQTIVDGSKNLPFPAPEYQLMSGLTKPLTRSPGGETVSCDFYELRGLQ